MLTFTPVLDWHPPSPQRKLANAAFFLSEMLPTWRLDVTLRSRQWTRIAWLDQHAEGACTGFGAAHCMSIGYRKWPMNESIARDFYQGAKRNDEWAGEDYEGSSVQGAMAYLKSINRINAYWWAKNSNEFFHGQSQLGAFEVGSWWYTGMFEPDADGYLRLTGQREGGHAYCIGGIDFVNQRARIDNSWGPDWGRKGSAWIELDDLCSLIFEQQGEAALPRKNQY